MNRALSQANPEDGFVDIFMSMMGSAPMNKRTKLAFGVRAMSFFVMFSWPALNVARAQVAETARVDTTAAQRAKQHFALGEGFFKSRKFDEALAEYELGYAEKPSPVFTFNMAQCQRLLGHSSAAIDLYRRYLREAPEGLGRAVAEQRIAELTADHQDSEAGTVSPTAAGPDDVAPAAATGVASTTMIGAAPIVATTDPLVASAPTPTPPEPAPPTAAPQRLFEPAPIPQRAAPAVTASAPADEPDRPIYRRWWFWAAAAAVASGSIIAIAASSSSRPACDPDRVCK